ncbi:MAG: PIN domain-containing protein [Candidatus Viridilinea halotolerans]|uniref:PIN domain-containing protein n=1 Tax=Candidatus Viridilinea halotolerans TaxID=2491704 RepID=A0A426U843_9CHLR|nr:MAG: PIN domain-containing protein [Candidatus Viridilinea halotolerans]
MRVLIDANILLDLILAREPFANEARAIWIACEQGRCVGFVAAISVTTIWYVGRRQVGFAIARQRVAELLSILRVAPVDALVLQQALASALTDFEDAVQLASALRLGLDAIVTRNSKDFVGATLPILTPAEFLARLAPPKTA